MSKLSSEIVKTEWPAENPTTTWCARARRPTDANLLSTLEVVAADAGVERIELRVGKPVGRPDVVAAVP